MERCTVHLKGVIKLIGERAMLQLQYSLPTSLVSESVNTQSLYMNMLPGTTSMGIPIVESTPAAQIDPTLFRPIPTPHVHDIFEPSANEQGQGQII